MSSGSLLESLRESWRLLERLLLERAPRKILLVTHINADIDAAAACTVLKQYLLSVLDGNVTVDLASQGGPSVAAREACARWGSSERWLERYEDGEYDCVIVVDAASEQHLGDFSRALSGSARALKLLIDHHQRNELLRAVDASLHEPRCASSSEIVALVLPERARSKEASCLLMAGIIADTGRYSRASPLTFLASYELYESCGQPISELAVARSELSERVAKLKALQRAVVRREGDLIVVATHVGSYEGQTASSIIGLGADVALVCSSKEESTIVIYRFSERVTEEATRNILKELEILLGSKWFGHLRAGVFKLAKSYSKRELPLLSRKLADSVIKALEKDSNIEERREKL
ncbi:MAG: DHH family phosphoesterase [Fervidicoccaceae archaeon]